MFGGARRLLGAAFEDLFGVVVLDTGLVAKHFVVGIFEELGAAVAELLADGLLYARVVEFALAGGLFGDELIDGVAYGPLGAGFGKGQHVVIWPGLSLVTAAYTVGSL